jgi:predicted GNAT superfamily acetyltransferase
VIRDLSTADIDRLIELNNAAVPAVSPSDAVGMQRLLDLSALALAITDDAGTVLAFAILMTPGVDYESENYRFFQQRGTDFLYVDRIVVAESARNRGLGAELYRAVFDAARQQGRAEVTCEVNVDPPNPGSLRFHGRLGFTEVGRQETKGGSVTVALLAASLARASEA